MAAALPFVLLAALRGETEDEAPQRKWPPRYTIRRITWHVLDHAWEMQDRRTS